MTPAGVATAEPTRRIRRLGSFEKAACLTAEFEPFNIVLHLVLEKAPDPDVVRATLTRWVQQQQIASLTILKDGKQRWFGRVKPVDVPISCDHLKSEDDQARIIEKELNKRLPNEDGTLFRFSYYLDCTQTNKGHLILAFHHAIVDGSCLVVLIRELMKGFLVGEQHESQMKFTEEAESSEAYFPKPFCGLGLRMRVLGMQFRELVNELKFRLTSPKGAIRPVAAPSKCRTLVASWCKEVTADLLRESRRRRCTLVAMLHASMLLAVNKCLFEDRKRRHRLIAFYDLRPYLDPPLPAQQIGAHLTMGRFAETVQAGMEFWELASRIQGQIYDFGKSGDKFVSNHLTQFTLKTLIALKRMRMGSTAISYTGSVPPLAPPCLPFDMTEFHAFVSNISLGPFFTANSRIFSQRLILDCLYLEGDIEPGTAQSIVNEMRNILETAIGRNRDVNE